MFSKHVMPKSIRVIDKMKFLSLQPIRVIR